jgi:L-asparagine transporter-like permease
MYIYLIILIKVCFILLAISHIYLKAKGKSNSELDKTILYWKDRSEFIFIFLMAILLIILFNPRNNKSMTITNETKILLYLFGIILLITAKWSDFIKESKWFSKVQKAV